MTAIFMVWNNSGFAIAADQSVSITNENNETLWTDTANKLFLPDNHKICVATAGETKINGIPIEILLKRWSEQLPDKLASLDDYATNFIKFIKVSGVPNFWRFNDVMFKRIRAILLTFKSDFDHNPGNIIAFMRDKIQEWTEAEPDNIYGNEFPDRANLYPIHEKPSQNLHREFAAKILGSLSNPSELELTESRKHLVQIIEDCLVDVFGEEIDLKSTWVEYLKEHLVNYLINTCDSEPIANLMFVGFGSSDWTARMVALNLRNFHNSIPRATISKTSIPEYTWYHSLAQAEQVGTFLAGIDDSYRDHIYEVLSKKFGDIDSEIDAIQEFEVQRLDAMRTKVRHLSLEKMEFIARSFVEMESLGSFLIEYLPSVGGKVNSLTMTR